MDPSWMEARTRYRSHKEKPKNSDIDGRFRRKLLLNPYAHALATPMRMCPITSTNLPKYFLQEFKAVTRPDTGDHWWTPGDIALPQNLLKEAIEGKGQGDDAPNPSVPALDTDEVADFSTDSTQVKVSNKHRGAAPTAYVVARKPLLQSLGGKKGKTPHGEKHKMLLVRSQPLHGRGMVSKLVWREDMDDFVLENMRRMVINQLLYFAGLREIDSRSYIVPLTNWDAITQQKQRGCLLWYQTDSNIHLNKTKLENSGSSVLEEFATFDVPGTKYEKKLPVHDLKRLLGPHHLAELMEKPLFRDNSLFLVRKQRSIPLQLYLWKLQAYLAEYPSHVGLGQDSRKASNSQQRSPKVSSDPHQSQSSGAVADSCNGHLQDVSLSAD
ncbi:hypothetical protein CCHL11_02450 [Colletotrichum chlorophyti]|uniref:Uncharacterized protein n=1 Tax=Colletotrichum chlorophyti TaxID=708187 RepID=A0A1Q8S659_9PEZI|nr:hypothetical protein CCHL11_02450 [Colletotrichum chlorophyti]